MVKAPEIPIRWRTKRATADRLLGDAGRLMLDQWLEHTRQVAAEREWPLKRIKVEYYQDEEFTDWEYILLVMDFDCPSDEAGKIFWEDYIKGIVGARQKELTGAEKEIFATMIHYELESNP
jgi:hypothetical protein